MTNYTSPEMAVIHFIYGAADGNALEARRLYGERFPSRRLPDRKIFERLHRRLRETSSFVSGMHDTGRNRNERTPELQEHALRKFEGQPETNVWAASTAPNVSQMMVWRVLGAEGLRRYHAQRVHAMKETGHQPRVDFSRFQQLAAQPVFAAHVLFTDQSSFNRKGRLVYDTNIGNN